MRPPRQPAYGTIQLPLYLGIFLLSVLACTVRSSPRRRLLFILHSLLSLFFIFFVKSDNVVTDYGYGATIATTIFFMLDFLVLTDIHNELRMKGQRGPIATALFFDRWKWAFALVTATRGIGWQHEPTAYLPKAANPTRGRYEFVLQKLVVLAQCGLLYIVGDVAIHIYPSIQAEGSPPPLQVWWLRPTLLGIGMQSRASINLTYTMFSIASVLLGWSSPESWPPLFGSFLDAYSVHNFWRRSWHQMMRRVLTVHATFVADAVNPSNKTIRTLLKLYVAFFVSGLIHYFADFMLLHNWGSGAITFFMLQALAITFENTALALIRRSGVPIPLWVAKMVGYIWVVTWFSTVYPIWIQPLIKVGFWEDGWHSHAVVSFAKKLGPFLGFYE